MELSEIQNHLLQKNILIRNCSNFVGLDENYFRVAVKTRADNLKLLNALKLLLGDVTSNVCIQKDHIPEFVTREL